MADDNLPEPPRGKYRFAMVPELAFRDTMLAKSALNLRVFGRMCFRANREGLCWETQTLIAVALSVDAKRVYEATSHIEKSGWITEVGGSPKRGRTFRINRDFTPPPERLQMMPKDSFHPSQRGINEAETDIYHPSQRVEEVASPEGFPPPERNVSPVTTDGKSTLSPAKTGEHTNRPKKERPGTDHLDIFHASNEHAVGADSIGGECVRGLTPTTSIDSAALFEAWWIHVPVKKAKGHAAKAYTRALKLTDHETLLNGVMRWAAEATGKDLQFEKHPATWLNAQCWLDQPIQQSSVALVGPGTQPSGRRLSAHENLAIGTAAAGAAARARKQVAS